jgi:hypothetical protein
VTLALLLFLCHFIVAVIPNKQQTKKMMIIKGENQWTGTCGNPKRWHNPGYNIEFEIDVIAIAFSSFGTIRITSGRTATGVIDR